LAYVLAVDSGGTKTDALLVASDGTVVGWGRCDVHHPKSGRSIGGSGRSSETVTTAVSMAFGNLQIDELHAKGLPYGLHIPAKKVTHYAVDEHQGAMAIADTSYGALTQSGTGSFVRVATKDGRSIWLDGLGPQLGDHGSAYQIGLMAIRAAGRANWNPRRATSLEKAVLSACVKGGSREDLVEYMLKHHDRAVIAALARQVDVEARAGDPIAVAILTEAAADLADTLKDAMESLTVTDSDFPLVGAGSVIAGSDVYWNALLRAAGPQFRPYRVNLPPVIGEALVVLGRVHGQPMADVRTRLLETAEKARP